MISEKIIGNIKDFSDIDIDYVDIQWHEVFKKLYKKTTRNGIEIGIRLDDSVLKNGVRNGDILYMDGKSVIAVNIMPCEIIEVSVDKNHPIMAAKVCYEIGNRHAPLFYTDDEFRFVTVYNEPMLEMLGKLHAVSAEKKTAVLDFDKRISASVHNHTH